MAGETADGGRRRPLGDRREHQVHQQRPRPQADPQVRPQGGLGSSGLAPGEPAASAQQRADRAMRSWWPLQFETLIR